MFKLEEKSIIKYIKQLYETDNMFFKNFTSCEMTSIYILERLKQLNIVVNESPKTFIYSDINKLLNIDDDNDLIIEIILYRRSHTFLLVKEKNIIYLVSSYLNIYKSFIKEIDTDFQTLLKNIYKIEFEDNIKLHNDLFLIEHVPCLTLDKKFSKMKVNLYEIMQ